MSNFRFIEIDCKRYLWPDILEQRRAQRRANTTAQQMALFEVKHDCRPAAGRTPAGRYLEPTLFEEKR
jgi:hypothetical protein